MLAISLSLVSPPGQNEGCKLANEWIFPLHSPTQAHQSQSRDCPWAQTRRAAGLQLGKATSLLGPAGSWPVSSLATATTPVSLMFLAVRLEHTAFQEGELHFYTSASRTSAIRHFIGSFDLGPCHKLPIQATSCLHARPTGQPCSGSQQQK